MIYEGHTEWSKDFCSLVLHSVQTSLVDHCVLIYWRSMNCCLHSEISYVEWWTIQLWKCFLLFFPPPPDIVSLFIRPRLSASCTLLSWMFSSFSCALLCPSSCILFNALPSTEGWHVYELIVKGLENCLFRGVVMFIVQQGMKLSLWNSDRHSTKRWTWHLIVCNFRVYSLSFCMTHWYFHLFHF